MVLDLSPAGHRVLVINPNASTFLTDSFEPILSALNLSPGTTLSYWTCPPGGPAMIKSPADMQDSAARCLPLLLKLAPEFDGFLAACYADHPVVSLLQSKVGRKPVVCIFHASVYAALQLVGPSIQSQFGILTTAAIYETLLGNSVHAILKTNKQALARFAGVAASDIGLADLQDRDDSGESTARARDKVIRATSKLLCMPDNVEVICMGGVVLAGMESWVHEAADAEGRMVKVIDQLAAGMLTLDALLEQRPLWLVDFELALK